MAKHARSNPQYRFRSLQRNLPWPARHRGDMARPSPLFGCTPWHTDSVHKPINHLHAAGTQQDCIK